MNTREQFGKYVLLKKLSEDPLGETFRAGRGAQKGLEQVVLLRVLNGQGLDAEKLWSVLSGRKEVQSALKSPNIGSGVDAGRVRGVPYVAYDYASGKDLATLSAQAQWEGSPFPTDHALLIADRIGLALTAAYETRHGGERVHHGMVVPHLVMISNEGETRLLGFEAGPALAAQAAALAPEIQRYLAPEVRTGAPPGKSSDVFSLGAILYELLTGKPLPAAPAGEYTTLLSQARLAAEGTPLPQPVAALLTKSLAAPDSRLPDPPSWHKALSRILSEGGHKATTFNLAFFMHNLFREEIEQESKEIEAEKTLEVPAAQGATVAPAAGAETVKIPREEARKAAAATAAAPPDDTSAVKARYGMEEEASEGSKKGLWIGLAAALVLAAVAAGVYFGFVRPRSGAEEPEAQEQLAEAQVPELEPQPVEPPEPAGPSPEELQAQIDLMFEERAEAMEATFKAEADRRIADLQRQLDQAQEAAEERSRRLEEARREAEAAREEAAAEEEEEEEEEPEQQAAGDQAGEEATGERAASNTPPSGERGTAGDQGAAGTTAAPEPQPVAPPPPPPPPPPEPEPEPEPARPEVKRGQLVSPGPGVVAPRLVRRSTPTFPSAAARLNREATVDVRVLVDENGDVLEAEIEGRRAGLGFDEAALQAARGSSFEAATKFEVPVKMWSTMRFVFKR